MLPTFPRSFLAAQHMCRKSDLLLELPQSPLTLCCSVACGDVDGRLVREFMTSSMFMEQVLLLNEQQVRS